MVLSFRCELLLKIATHLNCINLVFHPRNAISPWCDRTGARHYAFTNSFIACIAVSYPRGPRPAMTAVATFDTSDL